MHTFLQGMSVYVLRHRYDNYFQKISCPFIVIYAIIISITVKHTIAPVCQSMLLTVFNVLMPLRLYDDYYKGLRLIL